jgi:hypothetical protein
MLNIFWNSNLEMFLSKNIEPYLTKSLVYFSPILTPIGTLNLRMGLRAGFSLKALLLLMLKQEKGCTVLLFKFLQFAFKCTCSFSSHSAV